MPFDSHPFLEGRADGGQDGASPGYYPWRLQGPALPPSRLQNRKQEQTAACRGAPLLHAELNCLCISGRADTGLVNVRDRPQALVERGNRPQARARVSANKGGPGPLSLAHSTPSPEGRLRFHKGMVYFSDSTDVSEWETEAQPQVGAEGLVPVTKVELWFLFFLPSSFSQAPPPPPGFSSPFCPVLRIWLV